MVRIASNNATNSTDCHLFAAYAKPAFQRQRPSSSNCRKACTSHVTLSERHLWLSDVLSHYQPLAFQLCQTPRACRCTQRTESVKQVFCQRKPCTVPLQRTQDPRCTKFSQNAMHQDYGLAHQGFGKELSCSKTASYRSR